ncbi:hypothetical protein GCM10023178_32440 [Actinomadura luteofluorescens]
MGHDRADGAADRDDRADHQGDQHEHGRAEAVHVQAEGGVGLLPGQQKVERAGQAEQDRGAGQ